MVPLDNGGYAGRGESSSSSSSSLSSSSSSSVSAGVCCDPWLWSHPGQCLREYSDVSSPVSPPLVMIMCVWSGQKLFGSRSWKIFPLCHESEWRAGWAGLMMGRLIQIFPASSHSPPSHSLDNDWLLTHGRKGQVSLIWSTADYCYETKIMLYRQVHQHLKVAVSKWLLTWLSATLSITLICPTGHSTLFSREIGVGVIIVDMAEVVYKHRTKLEQNL